MNTTAQRVGIAEQLAAYMVEGENDYPGPSVAIKGTPGRWQVCVMQTADINPIWLAASRTPSVVRDFKSLDAAHAMAYKIHAMANPHHITGHTTLRLYA